MADDTTTTATDEQPPLRVDPNRLDLPHTGIYVRALHNDQWDAHDIAHLDAVSLLRWLRSRGERNEWAEQSHLLVLGHSHEDFGNANSTLANEQSPGVSDARFRGLHEH